LAERMNTAAVLTCNKSLLKDVGNRMHHIEMPSLASVTPDPTVENEWSGKGMLIHFGEKGKEIESTFHYIEFSREIIALETN